MKKPKIILMGTSSFALPSFREVLDSHEFEIVAIFTQPDKKAGRGKIMTQTAVKEMILREYSDIPIYQPEKFKAPENIALIKKLKPDLIFVVSYGHILPKEVLAIPKFGCVNLHASVLPLLRGSSPIVYAILNGFKTTGVTFFKLTPKVDDGDVIFSEEIPIYYNATQDVLTEELAFLGGSLAVDVLSRYLSGELTPKPQDHSQATFTKMIEKEHGKIDFAKIDALDIERMTRAYFPWPGVYTFYNDKRLKLINVKVSNEEPSLEAGSVFLTAKQEVAISTKEGSIVINTLQIEGKRVMEAKEFIRGYGDFVGSTL